MDIRLVGILLIVLLVAVLVILLIIFFKLERIKNSASLNSALLEDIYIWAGITYKELTEIGKQEAHELRQDIEEWRKSIKDKGGK